MERKPLLCVAKNNDDLIMLCLKFSHQNGDICVNAIQRLSLFTVDSFLL